MCASGVFVRAGEGKGFDRDASVKAYAATLRRAATGKRGVAKSTASEERTRLWRLQADAQEAKNRAARGELVSQSEVESTWAEIVVACRNAILAAPERIWADLPHLTPFDVQVIDRHLREALTRLGGEA